MSTVRLQLDNWLTIAKEQLGTTLVESICEKIRHRNIRLTQSSFLLYTETFASLLEKQNKCDAWKLTAKITSTFIQYLPKTLPKRAVVNNHFHLATTHEILPLLNSISISSVQKGRPDNIESSINHRKKRENVPGSSREEDGKSIGKVYFPIVCKLLDCEICKKFKESQPKCDKDNCKRKHRHGMHYLSHAMRRRLSRQHRFSNTVSTNSANSADEDSEAVTSDVESEYSDTSAVTINKSAKSFSLPPISEADSELDYEPEAPMPSRKRSRWSDLVDEELALISHSSSVEKSTSAKSNTNRKFESN